MRDAVKNVADKGQVTKAKKEEKRRELLRVARLKEVLGTRSGRSSLWEYRLGVALCLTLWRCRTLRAQEMSGSR